MSPGYVARFSAVMLTRLVLCGSMQFPDFPHQEYLEIPGGWGGVYVIAKLVEEKFKAKLKFTRGRGTKQFTPFGWSMI